MGSSSPLQSLRRLLICWLRQHGPLTWLCMWLQVSFVGATEEQARDAAQKAGYGDKLAVVKTSFRANSKVRHSAHRAAAASDGRDH